MNNSRLSYLLARASAVLQVASMVNMDATGAADVVKDDLQRVQQDLVQALAMITMRERRAAMQRNARLHQNMSDGSFDWRRERAVPPFPPPPPDEPDELDDSDTVDRFGLRDEM